MWSPTFVVSLFLPTSPPSNWRSFIIHRHLPAGTAERCRFCNFPPPGVFQLVIPSSAMMVNFFPISWEKIVIL